MFGGLFEIPMMMGCLVAAKIVTRQRFIKMRAYAIIGAFIMGMLLAPPDVLSQTIVALPIWLLYETGIILSRFVCDVRQSS
jgi:sec-independent protein translocase protein TatC